MSTLRFSTRFIRKGALINESRIVLEHWDAELPVLDNLDSILAANLIGAKSSGWLQEVRVSLSSRLGKLTARELDSLTCLAKSDCDHQTWVACLHWHYAHLDSLYFSFLTEWLFERFKDGTYRIYSENVRPFVVSKVKQIRGEDKPLSEYGVVRAARDLLRMATDFGLLTGAVYKEFVSYHLPEEGFVYVLHAMADREPNARRIVDAEDWRMYLMDSSDVERELLRLHQFRKIHYEVAGSLAQLKLPYQSSAAYARELCA